MAMLHLTAVLKAAVAAGVGAMQRQAQCSLLLEDSATTTRPPPATSCVPHCQTWEQTSASFTVNATLYKIYVLNICVLAVS